MKRILSIVLVIALTLSSLVLFSGCDDKGKSEKTKYDGFFVKGNTLYDANGEEFIMRGINIAHGWYKSFTMESLEKCAEFGCNTVRVVLGEGSHYDEDLDTDIARIIEKCKELNMVAVLEPHDFTGTNNPDDIQRAVKFWIKNQDVLIGEEKYVIINLANEWWGDWTVTGWRDGYISAIKQMREAGFKHTLMVDCAGYGQYAKSIFQGAQAIYESDVTGNTMFSIHMYDVTGGNERTVQRNIDKTLELGLCLCIGEFSCEHFGKEVVEDYIMEYTTQKRVGYIAWSYAGNGSGLQPLDVTTPWSHELTEWGKKLVNGPYGLMETSNICSVFDTDNDVNAANKNDYKFPEVATTVEGE